MKKRFRKTRTFRISLAQRKWYRARGKDLLHWAEEILKVSNDLDTAVRDNLADGLARVVWAGYDCLDISAKQTFITFEESEAALERNIQEWFRSRGFLDWFCNGASVLFRTSEPRMRAYPKEK